MLRAAVALGLAAALSVHGNRRGSLTPGGAVAAFAVGTLHLSCGWTFGCVLIAFYTTSSRLTRLHLARKSAMDASIVPSGRRGAMQVLCASCGGALAAALAATTQQLGPAGRRSALIAWCAFLGHYACCCADTWASELGMLSTKPPRLLTTLSAVPPGVHGAVSLLGLAASAAGGGFMGLVQWAVGVVTGELHALDQAPFICSHAFCPCVATRACFWLALGLACGLMGSLADSLLGATCQWSGVCHGSGRVVSRPGGSARHVSGRALLSNEAVNALSAALSGVAAAFVGWVLLLASPKEAAAV